ncbi:MAG: dockerin type I repeat-containing protein [Ruminococcus sp.]|nr:dockerin type I repeat-containing protein [Ruminococcus sp.]
MKKIKRSAVSLLTSAAMTFSLLPAMPTVYAEDEASDYKYRWTGTEYLNGGSVTIFSTDFSALDVDADDYIVVRTSFDLQSWPSEWFGSFLAESISYNSVAGNDAGVKTVVSDLTDIYGFDVLNTDFDLLVCVWGDGTNEFQTGDSVDYEVVIYDEAPAVDRWVNNGDGSYTYTCSEQTVSPQLSLPQLDGNNEQISVDAVVNGDAEVRLGCNAPFWEETSVWETGTLTLNFDPGTSVEYAQVILRNMTPGSSVTVSNFTAVEASSDCWVIDPDGSYTFEASRDCDFSPTLYLGEFTGYKSEVSFSAVAEGEFEGVFSMSAELPDGENENYSETFTESVDLNFTLSDYADVKSAQIRLFNVVSGAKVTITNIEFVEGIDPDRREDNQWVKDQNGQYVFYTESGITSDEPGEWLDLTDCLSEFNYSAGAFDDSLICMYWAGVSSNHLGDGYEDGLIEADLETPSGRGYVTEPNEYGEIRAVTFNEKPSRFRVRITQADPQTENYLHMYGIHDTFDVWHTYDSSYYNYMTSKKDTVEPLDVSKEAGISDMTAVSFSIYGDNITGAVEAEDAGGVKVKQEFSVASSGMSQEVKLTGTALNNVKIRITEIDALGSVNISNLDCAGSEAPYIPEDPNQTYYDRWVDNGDGTYYFEASKNFTDWTAPALVLGSKYLGAFYSLTYANVQFSEGSKAQVRFAATEAESGSAGYGNTVSAGDPELTAFYANTDASKLSRLALTVGSVSKGDRITAKPGIVTSIYPEEEACWYTLVDDYEEVPDTYFLFANDEQDEADDFETLGWSTFEEGESFEMDLFVLKGSITGYLQAAAGSSSYASSIKATLSEGQSGHLTLTDPEGATLYGGFFVAEAISPETVVIVRNAKNGSYDRWINNEGTYQFRMSRPGVEITELDLTEQLAGEHKMIVFPEIYVSSGSYTAFEPTYTITAVVDGTTITKNVDQSWIENCLIVADGNYESVKLTATLDGGYGTVHVVEPFGSDVLNNVWIYDEENDSWSFTADENYSGTAYLDLSDRLDRTIHSVSMHVTFDGGTPSPIPTAELCIYDYEYLSLQCENTDAQDKLEYLYWADFTGEATMFRFYLANEITPGMTVTVSDIQANKIDLGHWEYIEPEELWEFEAKADIEYATADTELDLTSYYTPGDKYISLLAEYSDNEYTIGSLMCTYTDGDDDYASSFNNDYSIAIPEGKTIESLFFRIYELPEGETVRLKNIKGSSLSKGSWVYDAANNEYVFEVLDDIHASGDAEDLLIPEMLGVHETLQFTEVRNDIAADESHLNAEIQISNGNYIGGNGLQDDEGGLVWNYDPKGKEVVAARFRIYHAKKGSIFRIKNILIDGEPIVKFKRGDFNGDGVVDVVDLASMARCLARWNGYEKEKFAWQACDFDGSGDISVAEYSILARTLARWPGYAETYGITVG